MAESGKLMRFWRWFGPNPLWWFVQWIGGAAVFTSIGRIAKDEFYRNRPDWILMAVQLLIGIIFIAVACWQQLKRDTQADSESVASPLGKPQHGGVMMPFADLNDVARNQDLVDLGMLSERLFTPLQIEALHLAHDLAEIIKPDKENPFLPDKEEEFVRIYNEGRARSLRISGTYAEEYAPKVRSFLNKIRKDGANDIFLPQFVHNVDSERSIQDIIARLWVYVISSSKVSLKGHLES